jgi:CHASE2 domain-containing sensor protein
MTGGVLTLAVGVLLCFTRLAAPFERLSYDVLFRFQPSRPVDDIVIIRMDELSHRSLSQQLSSPWSHKLHTDLVNQLTHDKAKLVVFDVFYAERATNQVEDQELAAAMKANGRVVLGAALENIPFRGLAGSQAIPPLPMFADAAAGWGIHDLLVDSDETVRRCFLGRDPDPSLSWKAAVLIDPAYGKYPAGDGLERWIRYYGPPNQGFDSMPYYAALNQPPGHFKDKVVFIGGRPSTVFIAQASDQFRTPYARWTSEYSAGVEIQATMFSNLIHHEWLRHLSPAAELVLIILAALLFGGGLATLRPGVAAAIGLVAVMAGTVFSIWLILRTGVWFSWVTVVGAQVPCAFAYAAFRSRAIPAAEARRSWESWAQAELVPAPVGRPDSALATPDDATQQESTPGTNDGAPTIPDHAVLRCIGQGGYGAVWLARNAVGLYHAVKIVYRRDFRRAQPYEREFKGIKNFMPVSFNHPGLVHLLHVGRNDQHGYFYYVMELGDDERSSETFNPDTYSPRTLGSVIKAAGHLPIRQCLDWFLPLADALAYLHQARLVHRDVKPSNVIFVHGVPKLADIGLVTSASEDEDSTYVGTEGFIPPEGPGTTGADIFAFGKVMYEAATGGDRRQYPVMPLAIVPEEGEPFRQFMNIVKRACEPNPQARYQSVGAIHSDLMRLSTELAAADAPRPST